MALRGSSPVNLNALRRDYSALPQIAAIKAQSSKQFLNAVSSGLEKRKEKIEKKELNEAAKKMIEPLLAKPEFQARFGTNANADEVLKLIGDPRKAVQLANDVITSEREFADRQRRIARESQIFAKGVYDLQAAERKVEGDKAFSSAIVGLSQDKDYQLTADQANLMAPNQIQDFIDIKAKQSPDKIGTIELGNGAYAITSNGEYKGMFTVPQDSKNALTARLKDIEGLRNYFKEAEDLFNNGRNTEAIQLLQALDVRVGNERVSMEDLESAKAIVGINVGNLQTAAGEAGGETGEKPIQILKIDGEDVSGQEKPKAEPKPEPAVEQTSSTPAPKQREVSIDEKGSIYDESGKIRSPLFRVIVENFFPRFANKPLTEEEQKELSKKVEGLIAKK